jgi:hypothetical protein
MWPAKNSVVEVVAGTAANSTRVASRLGALVGMNSGAASRAVLLRGGSDVAGG